MKETIIQFGEGNFLRAFFDWFIDGLNKKDLYDGKAVVVQPVPMGRIQALNEQKGKYNLYLRGIENGQVKEEHSVIESISRGVNPYEDFEGYLKLADNPDFRFIVSNTTEAGIEYDPSCNLSDAPCKSFPGKLTQLLYRRYKKGLNGFIILACELIDNNGEELKKCVIEYARQWNLEESFLNWLNEENVFVNTLVDRIVTGFPTDETALAHTEDKLIDTGEIFHLWVVEGNFEKELPLRKAGFNVVWTDDVKPYKKTKVRILNGAHTSMVAGALLSGIETVGECMEDEIVSKFLSRGVSEEILKTIGDNDETRKFAKAVFDRFKNPFIKHRLRSIALNSVSKFSVRVLPTILEYKEKNCSYPPILSMSLAYLIYFYKNDIPEDSADVVSVMKEDDIAELLGNTALWGTDISDMLGIVTECYEKIEVMGAKGAMEWILSK